MPPVLDCIFIAGRVCFLPSFLPLFNYHPMLLCVGVWGNRIKAFNGFRMEWSAEFRMVNTWFEINLFRENSVTFRVRSLRTINSRIIEGPLKLKRGLNGFRTMTVDTVVPGRIVPRPATAVVVRCTSRPTINTNVKTYLHQSDDVSIPVKL